MGIEIDCFGEFRAELGESPRWEAETGRLWQMDCRRGRIVSLDGATGAVLSSFDILPPCGSFAFNWDGQLIVALKETIVLLSRDGLRTEPLARIDDSHPNLRLNDGAAMPDGSFVVGTMHVFREVGEAPLGGIYRVSSAGDLSRIETGIAVTNGPCISPVTGRFHVCDSAERVIFSYEVGPDFTLTDKRVFAETSDLGSAPDGCCFDTEGGLWTALVHAGALVRYDSTGQVSHRIDLPVAHPAGVCFGGAALDEIFVTTISNSGRLRADGPLDGATLRVRGSGFAGTLQAKARIGA